MPSEILLKEGTYIGLGVSGSFSPADTGTSFLGAVSITQALTLAALADGAGRQSDKFSLGSTRAPRYHLLACVDFTGETPVAGQSVDYYWLPSTSATQAVGNVAGNSGADAAAPGGAVPSGLTVAEFALMGIYIGPLRVSDDAAVQNGYVGWFEPPTQWGQLLVYNQAGDAFEADDVEMHHVLVPEIPESQ